jgi:hypothetical protein
VTLRFLSSAERELADALKFYEKAEKGLGAEFLDEIEAAMERILTHPLAWTALSPRTRRCRTKRFPFALFYQVKADEILIVSVLDLRRDPGRWEQYL